MEVLIIVNYTNFAHYTYFEGNTYLQKEPFLKLIFTIHNDEVNFTKLGCQLHIEFPAS